MKPAYTIVYRTRTTEDFMSTETIDLTPPAPDAPIGPVVWVFDKADLRNCLEYVANASCVVMDLETTGLDPHAVTGGQSNGGVAARVALATLTVPQKDARGYWDGVEPTTYIIPLSHPRSPFLGSWRAALRAVARTLVKYSIPFVNHHAKFDAHWTYVQTGVDISHLITWDTQSSSHLIDETQSTKLKEVVPRRFGIERWDDHDLSYPGAAEDVDIWELGEYAAKDTYWCFRLYYAHLQELFLAPFDDEEPATAEEVADARLGRVAKYVSMPTARCLGMMEQQGIRLDIPYVRNLLEESRAASDESLDLLAAKYDMPRDKASTATSALWFKELTAKAIEDGELTIASMTRAGSIQWTKHILKKQARRGSETARLILEQRNAEKQAQFLASWLEKVTPAGFIHSTYRAGHVATGRLSSSGPNMQQVSKTLRPAFIPRDGYYLADLDYSQLELRVAAFISRCQPMLEAYAAGQDLHSLLAADILTRRLRQKDPDAAPVPLSDVSPADRQGAKSANFGLLYGQGAVGFRNYADQVYEVEFTEEEAQEVYDGFFATWEGMAEWHEKVKREARQRGYAVSPIGRRRNLPDIRDGNEFLRGAAERQALNAPVQGFGSDLMQMAIASIYGQMPGTSPVQGVYPVATVHDSLVVEVPQDGWQEAVAECTARMENLQPFLSRMDVTLDVPLEADAAVGTRWGLSDIA